MLASVIMVLIAVAEETQNVTLSPDRQVEKPFKSSLVIVLYAKIDP